MLSLPRRVVAPGRSHRWRGATRSSHELRRREGACARALELFGPTGLLLLVTGPAEMTVRVTGVRRTWEWKSSRLSSAVADARPHRSDLAEHCSGVPARMQQEEVFVT